MKKSNRNQTEPDGVTNRDRRRIAFVVLGISIVLLLSICAVYIFLGGANKSPGEASDKVFTTLIPLIGTWIGTVLAFYFSGENLQSATKSVSQLASQIADERLQETRVSNAMMPIENATVIFLAQDDLDGSRINLQQNIIGVLNSQITRIPILDNLGRVRYLLHQSMVYKFVSEQIIESAQSSKQIKISSFSLKDLLDYKENRSTSSQAIAYVGPSATLAEAKRLMESLRKCQDIFVTEDGTANSKAIGWLTNVIISRYSKV